MNTSAFLERMSELCAPLSLSLFKSVTIAQAALESSWGGSGLTTNANALFGIKAGSGWTGKTYNATTHEVINNTTITTSANFRAYDSWGLSIIDHDSFLRNNSRYRKVLEATTPEEACRELQAAGYATDPFYATKLINIIETYNLKKYDTEEPTLAPEKTVEILANPGETLHIVVKVLSN